MIRLISALIVLASISSISINAAELKESLVNNKNILKIISTIYSDPFGDTAPENLSVLVKYVEAAEKIHVSIKADTFDTNDKYATLYMGFYIAGAAKYDLENPGNADDKTGLDKTETDNFLKQLYTKIKEMDTTYSSDFYSAIK